MPASYYLRGQLSDDAEKLPNYPAHIALLEGDFISDNMLYLTGQIVSNFKLSNLQDIQAWYQFKV